MKTLVFPKKYYSINKQHYKYDKSVLVPIRYEDRYEIMKWRNEQIYHLRQKTPLTKPQQDKYFSDTIVNLFNNPKPDQVIFSYLYNKKLVGYGGLVHINWEDSYAEISFLINTKYESEYFDLHWKNFLILIEEVAFDELKLNKIFTYAFDLRPHLYECLEKSNYEMEARLKEHCFFNNKYIDVVIHSKISNS